MIKKDNNGRFIKGNSSSSQFKKGHTPWNKDKKGYKFKSYNLSEEGRLQKIKNLGTGMLGKKQSEKTRLLIKKGNTGKIISEEQREQTSKTNKEKGIAPPQEFWFEAGHKSWNVGLTAETDKRIKQYAQEDSIRKKKKYQNNPELHPNRIMAKKGFISNPQKELFKIVKLWYGNKAELEYPLILENSTIFGDVVVPSEQLWFEYDGSYWHDENTMEKDNNRQKEIEKRGFKVFRFDKNSLKELKGNLMEDVNVRRYLENSTI